MLTLGIDPGTATTGYGLITEKKNRLVFVDHGVISTSRKDTSQARLRKIYSSLKVLILDYKPKAIAVEKLYFGANTKTAIAVGQARGIVLLTAAEFKIPLAEYTPLEVKMAITGYGRADKKQIQQMVKNLLGLSDLPKPDDAADALAIAICHIHSYRLASL
ncbi:Holliday junction resolvase [candidate division WOR-1 bacterium DG_54_3]|uniref:Crossover junction endodeoxyribonuclease RuvC n=1 Tax=candidate division WOR-1 bacterium DG_54_3 TaxID=1703775 RepID=A0A0S7Y450_UNCSA|nr:MAG: Holliday junction resolvase [candidate division WOR-1 bacterium DG_54_3]